MTTEDFDRERLGRRVTFGLASFSPVVNGWARDLQSALAEIDRLREALSEEADRIEHLDVENERLRAELRRFQRIIALDEIAAISQDAGLDELTGEPPIRR